MSCDLILNSRAMYKLKIIDSFFKRNEDVKLEHNTLFGSNVKMSTSNEHPSKSQTIEPMNVLLVISFL